jgi:DNA-binding CsgD family transcriptional regulator
VNALARISASDYRGVLEVLHEAGDVSGALPFPRNVLEALRRLVPCDVVTYHERLEHMDLPRLVFSGEPLAAGTPEIHQATLRYAHQDPLTPADSARMYSDFLTRRERRRLALYQEADRPLGVEYMMRLWLDPSGLAGSRLEFDRSKKDFSERDRAVLDLLLPHLAQYRRRAAQRRRFRSYGRRTCDLSVREREIITRVAEGRTNAQVALLLRISAGTLRKHLENAYEKLGVHTRTGAVAALFDLEVD